MFIKKGQAARNKLPLQRPAAEKIFIGLKKKRSFLADASDDKKSLIFILCILNFHYASPKHY